MSPDDVIQIFRDTGALLEGHFVYASGRHGKHFLQASRVLQYPNYTEELCRALAVPFRDERVEMVIGPATGGIILAYETARHLACRAAFTEKDGEGGFALKRGFALESRARVLVVEDIVTTGGSIKKTLAHLKERGAHIVGVAALIDRSGGDVDFGCRYEPLARFTLESWEEKEVPAALKAVPVMEPDDMIV
jgi:orotate phosphoribosyltransferase